MKRNRSQILAVGALTATLAGVMILGLLWIAGDAPKPPSRDARLRERADEDSSVVQTPGQSLDGIESDPFRPEGTELLRVRDLLSHEVIKGFTIHDASGETLAREEAGLARIPSQNADQLLIAELPPRAGAANIEFTLSSLSQSIDGIRELEVPAYSDLTLEVVSASVLSERQDAHCIISDYPGIPENLDAETHLSLERKRLWPSMYRHTLVNLGVAMLDERIGVKVPVGSSKRTTLPFAGEVLVSVYSPGMIPLQTIASVARGEHRTLEISLEKKPVVSGTLFKHDGTPMADSQVTVYCKSKFHPNEVIPHAEHEPGNAAISVIGSRRERGMDAIARLTVKTSKEGAFSARMPFTDSVMCQSAIPGETAIEVTRSAGSRTASVNGVKLRMARLPSDRQLMKLTNGQGEPIPDARLVFQQYDPPHPFQAPVPVIMTDSQGRFPTFGLMDGVIYLGRFQSRELGRRYRGHFTFEKKPGQSIVLD